VKNLIILGMSKVFIKESSFQNVHQKNLLDKAIVKVVNIKKVGFQSYLCGLGSVREKNFCVSIVWYKKLKKNSVGFVLKKIN
jgi:hypothetical protein